ncbi:MAG: hypothetical protein ACR652_26045 [Methylocystis sp.]|uniref:hypothetical protein n=1 Tax=Methylocystis sp. TaxID=1911079 RepID=UPI003DA200A3
MGFFYFDESIRDHGGFIVGAFIYSEEELTPLVLGAITRVGLQPKVDEFKSSSQMTKSPQQLQLRSALADLLRAHCRVGVLVLPRSERESLGREALRCLGMLIKRNGLLETRHMAFFDEGIAFCDSQPSELLQSCEVVLNQDSRVCAGIQIADYAAHCLGSMLLEEIGLLQKTIKNDSFNGYEEGIEIELGFELWASLRYSFFMEPPPVEESPGRNYVRAMTGVVTGRGLHIAETCDPDLRQAAVQRFGTTYLGCIY